MSKYGEVVKELRLQKKWSQRQLALNANISNTEVSRIENGLRDNPSLTTVEKLARVFGITSKEFLALIGDEEKANIEVDNKQPKDLAKFLEQSEVMFDGEVHKLNDESRKKLRTALEFAFFEAKKMNKRTKD